VQNPFDQPVVIYQQFSGGTWTLVEQWIDQFIPHNRFADKSGATYRTDDGAVLNSAVSADFGIGGVAVSPPNCTFSPSGSICPPVGAPNQISWHPNGSPSQYACTQRIPPVAVGVVTTPLEASANLGAQVYLNPGIRGNEQVADLAARTNDGGFIVPGSTGAIPARAVVYLHRLAAVTRAEPAVARVESYDAATLVDEVRYQRWIGDWLDPGGIGCLCAPNPSTGEPFCASTTGTYFATRAVHVLLRSTSTLTGGIGMSTAGLQPSGKLGFGQPTIVMNANYARSFTQ